MRARALAACTAVVALLLIATPASAQTGGSANLIGVSNGMTVTGTVPLTASATANAGANVRSLEITIDGTRVAFESYDGLKESASIGYHWNTRAGRNSEFTVRVNATFSGGGSAGDSANVKVANEAVSPSGVSARYDGNAVVVSWNPNPEPDISGYRVERDSGGGWGAIGTVYSTSIADQPGPGSHSYRVIAVRQSPAGDRSSAPSAAVSEVVPAAAAGSGSGSGGGGGSSGGGGYFQGGGGGKQGFVKGAGKNGLPGYNGKKGKAFGKFGAAGSPWSLGFAGSRMIGAIGLPRLTLPTSAGALSPAAQKDIDWGSFEENLPYDLDAQGQAFPSEFLGGRGRAAINDFTIIPPDGLRWVAAGALFLVGAAMLRFLERRMAAAADGAEGSSPQATEEAAS